MSEHPKRVNVGIRKKSGEIVSKWIQIRYDYLPKYCKTCKLQGHNKEECFVLHPELFEERKKERRFEGGEQQKGGGVESYQHRRRKEY